MIDLELVKHVLIIMPVSLLKNWEREFKKWCPGIAVSDFHSDSKKARERNLLRVQKRGHVLLTTYGMILNNVDQLSSMNGTEFVWDYLILDEGHKIKNATKTTKAVHDLPSKNRIVLTGTPIQNNLRELWSLFDFVHQGTLLGSLKTFKTQYENTIVRSREKDATSGEKQLGAEMSENLKDLINPYFLRRTKAEILADQNKEVDKLEKQMKNMSVSLPKKNDLILWTFMSEEQIKIYRSFLHSDAVKEILVSKRSPLVELTVLKKICDHPRLLSRGACSHMGLGSQSQYEDDADEHSAAPSIDGVTDEMLLLESGKMNLVICLIEELKETGHRALVFSSSRKILDMIQRILINRKFKILRLDGTVSKTEERERRIQKFQEDSSYLIFLLTTQVGGVGINLTAADRVIIYDPSWNPATDAQAVDRVFRIGQKKKVIVYRLITCGTVEEKIYRRQIFKDSITRQTTGDNEPYRYFSKQELRELFTFEDPYCSVTQAQLHQMHSHQREADEALLKHTEFLQSLNVYGISDHDLMFSKEEEDHTEDNDETAISKNFIKAKVAAAHELIKKEASVAAEEIRITGTFNRPYQEPVGPSKPSSKVTEWYKPPVLPDVSSPDRSSNRSENTSEIITVSSPDESHNEKITPEKRYVSKERNFDIQTTDTETKRDNAESKPSFKEYENDSHQLMCLENHPALEKCEKCELHNNSEDLKSPGKVIHSTVSEAKNCRKSRRVSCVRQSSTFLMESEDEMSKEDSSNSASISFVPDSTTNSPQESDNENHHFIPEIPPSPELPGGNSELDDFFQKHGSNVRRITPLKVDKSFVQENNSFVQAMASSCIITPQASPEAIQDISFEHLKEQTSLTDSPVYIPKKRIRQLDSESDEDYEVHVTPKHGELSDSDVESENKVVESVSTVSMEGSLSASKMVPKHNMRFNSDVESDDEIKTVETVNLSSRNSSFELSDAENETEITLNHHSVLQEMSHISGTSERQTSPYDKSIISEKNDSASASDSVFHSENDSASLFSDDSFEKI